MGRSLRLLSVLSAALTTELLAGSGAVALPTIADAVGYANETAIYTYDAPALLSLQSAATPYVRGSPAGPRAVSWETSAPVGGRGVTATSQQPRQSPSRWASRSA